MNKPNFLSLGLASLGSIATIGITATSVSAVTLAYEIVNQTQLLEVGVPEPEIVSFVEIGDKRFDNFEFSDQFVINFDEVLIGFEAGEFFFEVSPSDAPAARIGTIEYDVTIFEGDDVFSLVEIDSDVVGDGEYQITKNIEVLAGVGVGNTFQIESIDGDIDSTTSVLGATSLAITDTFIPNGDVLFSADNGFAQTTTTPEPGTIFGLLAVGGLGFGLKKKKQ